MRYAVNIDKPLSRAIVHRTDCHYYVNRVSKKAEDGGWEGPFASSADAIAFARSTGMRTAREAGCCASENANPVKARWAAGEVALGGWLSLPSSLGAEIMAREGFDYLCIDMQHGGIDYQTALTMLQAIGLTETVPFVRVPWNEPGIIGKVLDAGAMGVIIPMVNSVEEAQAAVAACRYHPEGKRSFGPLRAAMAAGGDYFAEANATVACIPMIETEQALEDLDAILAVEGIDAVYVGPADLSITLGQPPAMANEGRFEEARLRIAAACRERGVVAGIHANAGLAAKHREAGYRMVTISSDQGGMRAAARADLTRAREE